MAEAGHSGPVPDTVVLVHEGKLYQQSEAALRAAQLLGFPWMLLAVFWVVPRPIRDAVYRWIARNRYRWFGRKEACPLPSPETSARFLDAHEPPPDTWQIQGAGERGPNRLPGSATEGAARLAGRVGLSYWLLYLFPFPLNLIPESERALVYWTEWYRNALTWFGDFVCGIELTVFEAGSGDTTSNYIEIVMRLTAAGALGATWHFVAGRQRISGRALEWIFLAMRYYLASMLMLYGWIKVFPAQMPPPGPDRLLQPIGDASPMGMVWTFLGASPAYQAFGGLSELFAGVLLLFRRTALLGALISLVVMTNVAALNYFYDVPVKLFSTHLVLLSLVLMVPDLPRLGALLFFHLPTQPRPLRPYPWARTWQKALAVVIFLGFLYQTSYKYAEQGWKGAHSYGAFAEYGPLHGFYRIESVSWGERSDRELEDHERWVRVGISHRLAFPSALNWAVVRADGSTTRTYSSLDLELGELRFGLPLAGLQEFVIEQGAPRLDEEGNLSGDPPDALVLWTDTEQGEVRIRMVRDHEYRAELVERGFHWINEYPRNR